MANVKIESKDVSLTNQRVLEIFSLISKPSEGKENSEKIKEITKILKENGIKTNYLIGAGLIVPAKKHPKIIILSHYDLIPTFEKKFDENVKENSFALKVTEKGNIKGALDNTITNAVLIDILINNPEILENVEIVFTEEEETGCIGSRNYMRAKDYAKDAFIINLDVTNEGYEKYISLEYDKPHWSICKLIDPGQDVTHWTTNRVTDDLDSVLMEGGNGISICLPTKGIIHSMKNTTTILHLENYRNILSNIVKILLKEDNIVLEGHFEYLKIEDAIKISDINELKKAEEEAKEKAQERYSYNYSWDWDNETEDDDFRIFAPDYEDFIKYQNKKFIQKQFKKAIKEIYEENSYFFEDDTLFSETLDFYEETTILSLENVLEDLPFSNKSAEFIDEIRNEIAKMLDGMGSYFGLRIEKLSEDEKKFIQAALTKGVLVNVSPVIGEWKISIPFDKEFIKLLAMEYVY